MNLRLSAFLWICGGLWAAALGAGMNHLMAYDNTPAAPRVDSAAEWPKNSVLPRDSTKPTLVMLAHPRCPCTRASIAELARVQGQMPDKSRVIVLFTVPDGMPPGWEKTDLWRSAAAIPGVRVLPDRGGAEASRFGATTSGQCFLFSPGGHRLFTGGITASRGHEGDNAGKDALVRLLSVPVGAMHPIASIPVFGCALATPVSH